MDNRSGDLFLFDIDGTLLSTSGSGYRSFTRSCQEVLGIKGPLNGIKMAGKLDRMIFNEISRRFRPELEEEELAGYWQRFKEKYIRFLRAESRTPEGWHLKPGIKELLAFCRSRGKLALLTGNVRQGARIKLAALGIAEYFPTGGFGEEPISRPQLARLAFEEACRHYKTEFSKERTFVIGDTVYDIRAGHSIGAKSIAVATGTVSVEQLSRAGADLLVKDFLSEAQKVRDFISS